MNATTIGLVGVGIVFIVDIVLLVGLVGLKAYHRRRTQNHESRRAAYVATLSRHLASEGSTGRIAPEAADDDAFIDAVIDLRNVVSGAETETLTGLVDGLGVAERQVAKLRSRFPLGRRLRAAVALAEIGDESTAPVLIEHLADREPEIRIQCARGLGRMRITMAIDAILERLGREDPWVRVRFADTLIGYGAKATWPLTAYIRVNLGYDENRGVIEAIRVLGTIGDREVGPALAGVLRVAADPEVRLAAIEALGFVGGPMAIPPLENALRSSDWRLRAKAATALGHIGDPTVNRALTKKLTDDDWWVRRNSAAALASLPGGDRLLFDAIRSADPLTRDAAAEALADIGALTAARERDEAGLASEEDLLLLEHVTAGDSVLV
jgi:HEAT repeat protein